MGKQPLVYIIIANWRRYQDTSECLDSLYKLKYKNIKVVIVDNESQNEEANKLFKKYPQIILIKNKKNLGFCLANNQGVIKALDSRADFVLLLNNDTVVKSNFLTILINYAQEKNFQGILTPKILYYNSNKIWAMGGKLSIFTTIPRMIGQGKPSSQFNKVITPNYASGCALLINSEVLRKVGLLNNIYFAYYEDTDLSFRVKKAGYKIKVLPKSVIWHKVSQSTKQNRGKIGEMQSYLHAKNGLIFGNKNLFGIKKAIYLVNQILVKFPLFIILKCDGAKARSQYARGIVEGIKSLSN